MRRLFWLAAGLGAGVTGALLASRWARRQADRMAPANVAKGAGDVARDLASLVSETVREFRQGMVDKEAEVRASLPK